ncbi:MAG TPA: hypothetical protein VFU43_01190 [Streptosporangiaceae bacterium]|nr:hypothetical protein [Streptosporangiaceae bacterium]
MHDHQRLHDHQRRRRSRHRDSGLARIGAWTRRSIASGVVLAVGLAGWVAYTALPGAATSSTSTQTAPAQPTASGTPAPEISDDGGLAPPAAPPAPQARPPASSRQRSHATSGGS